MSSGPPPMIGSPAWDDALTVAGTSRERVDTALSGAVAWARSLEVGLELDAEGNEPPAPEPSEVVHVDEHRLWIRDELLATRVAAHWLVVELRRSSASLHALWGACMTAVEADPIAYRFWIDQLASFLAHGDDRDALTIRQFLAADAFFSRRPAPAVEPFGEMLARVPQRVWWPILDAAWEVDWRLKEPWLERALAEPALHGAVVRTIETAVEKGEIVRAQASAWLAKLPARQPPPPGPTGTTGGC